MDLYEALYTTRAMRRVTTDPIPEDVVKLMLDAAVRAPSGTNAQNWRWITVTDRSLMRQIATLYAEGWDILQNTIYQGRTPRNEQEERVMSSSQWLTDNFADIPLLILPFHRNDPSGASIYPAVWNLMLAARGQGVGTTLTTILGLFKQDELCELLGVPTEKGWRNAAAIPCGFPTGRWGIATRGPANQVAFAERWGEPVSWSADEPVWGGAAD